MIHPRRKQWLIGGTAVVILLLLVFAFLPKPIPIESAVVRRGALQVTVEEEGVTEVADRYALTAPVSAQLQRIQLEVGDVVQRGQAVIVLASPRAPLLDVRSRTEALERVRAAQAVAQSAADERNRTTRLYNNGAATQQQLDQATHESARAAAELAAAQAAMRLSGGSEPVQTLIRSPVAGRVLAVRRRSAGQVNPGDTLIVLGDARNLEIHVDVLSEDAVRIHAGTPVQIDQWGGDTMLAAVVRRVEPQGFTKVSSLGVEEQRVPVVVGLTSPPELSASLGSGYRVLARFIIWQAPDVLQVPTAALFRAGDGWAVFTADDAHARRRRVTIGEQAGLQTEIRSGLHAGEHVIVHPSNAVSDGARIKAAPPETAP